MRQRSGFTVIEMIIVIAVLGVASILFFIQKNDLEKTSRDDQRKIAINAMYYGLEEVYYPKHKTYPRKLEAATLPSVDKKLFTDPNGIKIDQTKVTIDDKEIPVQPEYTYEGINCDDDQCQSYELRTTLENEDDFVRKSRN